MGHFLSKEGIQVDPNKIYIIRKVPTPKIQKYVRIFLGIIGYYRRFIKDFRKIVSSLFGLQKKIQIYVGYTYVKGNLKK